MRLTPSLLAVGVVAVLAPSARAAEPAPRAPVHFDVTEASSVLYNFDNRDTKPNQVSSRTNDRWGLWYNRLNLQASWGEWQLGLRIDSALFWYYPNPTRIALDMVDARDRPLPPTATDDPTYFRQNLQAGGEDLSNRYLHWTYPAKYYLGYSNRDVELTLGDFYAQLGRGFVLSVRKLDELASDTTIRGARATTRVRAGDLRLRLTALGGELNPLRIDEASGRYLGVGRDVRPSWLGVTEAGMPRAVSSDFAPERSCGSFVTCTYAPDRVGGAQVEIATRGLKLGTQAAMYVRQAPLTADTSRSSDQALIGSQSIELPDLGGKGSVYVEVAAQRLRDDGQPTLETRDGTSTGSAAFAGVTYDARPVTLTLEGKHYRRFFPMAANVAIDHAREFGLVQYNAPPTTEAFWVDTEFNRFNTCVSGARLKSDVEVGSNESLFVWVGRWSSWSESVANDACEISRANENRVWDFALGTEVTSQARRSRASVTLGARVDSVVDREIDVRGGSTPVFYQEGYLRYDVIRHLGGPLALQLQGWHRRRFEPEAFDAPWFEGQHLTGIEVAPHFNAALGVEYDTKPGVPGRYFNGQIGWKVTSDSSVSLFVGQRRGALRCVGGVCRVFPPFEGARLDATVRF